jgi:hypothetical protein
MASLTRPQSVCDSAGIDRPGLFYVSVGISTELSGDGYTLSVTIT